MRASRDIPPAGSETRAQIIRSFFSTRPGRNFYAGTGRPKKEVTIRAGCLYISEIIFCFW